MINHVFEQYNPYLRGLKKAENYNIVEVHLKTTWTIPEHETILNQKKLITDNGQNLNYHMLYSESDDFDTILTWLMSEVIIVNVEQEEKEQLLKSKVEQLKKIFETNTLTELKKLKFISEGFTDGVEGDKVETVTSTTEEQETVES